MRRTNACLAERIGLSPTVSTRVALLTGGGDKPYALGLAAALTAKGTPIDFIGSDDLRVSELLSNPLVNFFNLRGDQRSSVTITAKVARVAGYYWRLFRYAAISRAPIFHVLWNNKFELIDRTLLMLYYKMLRKRLVLTAHNVNARKRDANDSLLNRCSLKVQYALSDHIFVHSEKMKTELATEFGVSRDKVTVIPFGINNTVPTTTLSIAEAKRQFEIRQGDKTLLFFGNIAPYKGLEYLVTAFCELLKEDDSYRLIIAGRPKGDENYWERIRLAIRRSGTQERIVERIEYVPDEQTEFYFKAADVLVLPYTRIFQSGVLFLGYAFGLPVIATDVGSLRDDIIEGETGFLCQPENSADLAKTIASYFASDLYQNLQRRRLQIQEFANDQYSWSKVSAILERVYRSVIST